MRNRGRVTSKSTNSSSTNLTQATQAKKTQAKKYDLIATAEHAGRRLDAVLHELLPDYSRTLLKRNIQQGNAKSADGARLKPAHILSEGEKVFFELEPIPLEDSYVAQEIPLEIVHEDEAFLIVNKPAGMVAHPAAGHRAETLVNALLAHDPTLRELPRAGLVHRLDKDTSGLLLVAKNQLAYQTLTDRMQKREIRREYWCLVRGRVISGGCVDKPIGRHPVNRKKMAVVDNAEKGRRAVTHYTVEEHLNHYTVLRVALETGRTHQIRVHLAYARHPVFGDKTYGERLYLPPGMGEERAEVLRAFKRQALHARYLSFAHPVSDAELSYESLLPDDINAVLGALRDEKSQ